MIIRSLCLLLILISSLISAKEKTDDEYFYFPPNGNDFKNQNQKSPSTTGLETDIVQEINQYIKENPYTRYQIKPRWALWRHGYLIHVEGDFYEIRDVASLRKTWHAMIAGAAILQGKIPALDQKISEYEKELRGKDRSATWRHVLTQSAGFDYPYGDYPDYAPGEMWTYSDINLVHLCHALAKVYGKRNYFNNYADVAREAYFDAIGLEGWSTQIVKDDSFGDYDGVRFVLSLENMGRLGLLALNRGKWKDKQLVPEWFVKELETKQTYGMKVNYNGPMMALLA